MDSEVENLNSSIEETENIDSQNDAPEQEQGETKEEYTEREKQYYARIKELEKKLKEKKEEPSQDANLSPRDFLALKDANITADDFEEVQDFATYKKLSIADALAHPTLKTILQDRAEERRTARATETRSPRGVAKTSGEDFLKKAESQGEVPESDEGLRAMLQARLERRRNK
jgi:hypothetical protein